MRSAPLALLVLLALAGCPGRETGGTATTPAAPGTVGDRFDTAGTDTGSVVMAELDVQVTLVDYDIRMPATLAPGTVTFNVTNTGSHEHSFEVEGAGIERALDTPLQPGQTGQLRVDLRRGTYNVYCPVADHEQRGMSRQLIVQ